MTERVIWSSPFTEARAVKHNKGMVRASAQKLVDIRTKQAPPEKNPAAVALGRLGGLKGGKARAKNLTPEQRKEIAQRAAKQRWARKKGVGQESATDILMRIFEVSTVPRPFYVIRYDR